MTPLNSPALPAVPSSSKSTPASGKQAPEPADGRAFANALEQSRQAQPQGDPSQADAAGAAAKPRAGKASAAKDDTQDNEATLSAPLAEVLLAAVPVPAAPAAFSLPPANPLAPPERTAAAGATAALQASARALAAADAADAAPATSAGGDARLPDIAQADPAAASAAVEAKRAAPSRRLAGDAASFVAAAGPVKGDSTPQTAQTAQPVQPGVQAVQQAQPAQSASDATGQAGAAQPASGESGAATSAAAATARRQAEPHPAANSAVDLAADTRSDVGTSIGAAALPAADVVANSGNGMRPGPSAAAPRRQDMAARDDVSPALVAGVAAAPNPASPAAPASVAAAGAVAPAVGSDNWGAALGHQLVRFGRGSGQVAELNLNPAHLGPLKVTLSISDNQAQVAFVSAHAAVRDAVQAALPQLRASFADTGISLGQTSVGAESRQDAPRDQPSAPWRDGSRTLETVAVPAGTVFAEPSHADASTAWRVRGSGVDTFA